MSKKRRLDMEGISTDQKRPSKAPKTASGDKVELAKTFENLASDAEDVRLEAALDLVARCKNNSGVGKEPNFSSAEPVCARLIRGLCSSRKSARHGFFVALVEVLRLFKSSSELKQGCLDLIQQQTKISEATEGQERRDYLVGRMSALAAVIHSKLFFNGSDSQMVRFKAVLNALVDTAASGPWLLEQLGTVLCQTIDVLVGDRAPSAWFEAITEMLESRRLAKTSVGIAVWLEIAARAPSVKLPNHVWRDRDPLSDQELPTTIQIMKKSTGGKSVDGTGNERSTTYGARQAVPSFTWAIILSHLWHDPANSRLHDKQMRWKRFEKFWKEAIDEHFFYESSSHERRYLGFQLLLMRLSECTSSYLKCMLSPNLLRSLASQSAQPDRYLHSIAQNVLHTLVAKARTEPPSGLDILRVFLSGAETINFDLRSKTQTVTDVFEHCLTHVEMRRNTLDILCEAFEEPIDLEAGRRRQNVVDMLNAVIRRCHEESNEKSPVQRDCISSCLDFLSRQSYREIPDAANEQSTDATSGQQIAQKALNQSLALLAAKSDDASCAIVAGSMNEIAATLIKRSDTTEKEREALRWLRRQQSQHLENISKDEKTSQGFFGLLCQVSILMFADRAEDGFTTFEEVRELCLKSSLTQNDVNVTIDMLLSFISQPPVVCRRLAMRAFQLINAQMGLAGLHALCDVLTKKENISGKNDLEQEMLEESASDTEPSAAGDKDDNELDDHIEIDSSDDDVEEVDASEADSLSSAADSDAQSDSSELTRFNAALASTLRTKNNKDAEADSSSDESMDDDQMLALEPHLAEIFRQRLAEGTLKAQAAGSSKRSGGERKQAQAAARRDILDFKNRVLDMLEIYLTRNPGLGLTLEAAVPMLELVRMTGSTQLRAKATKILKAWQTAAKKKGEPPFVTIFAATEGKVEQRTGWDVLAGIHEEALARPFSYAHAALCSGTSLFVCRCAIRSAKKGSEDKIVQKRIKKMQKVYAETKERAEEAESLLLKTDLWRNFEEWRKEVLKNVGGGGH